jgi:peptidoglycan/LPS O-acetylase OafA/YrhL
MPRGPGADTPGQWMIRQVLYGATAFFLLLPAVFGPQDEGLVRRLLRSRVFVFVGLISYGIYLWHEGVIDVWMHRRNIAPFTSGFLSLLAVAVVGTVAVAVLSYVVVERPALARKSPRRATSTTT